MERLPLLTQTLYSELLEQLAVLEATRTIGNLPGCFNFKTVKKRKYCYFQTSEPGGISRQLYIGPADLKIESIIDNYQLQKDAFRTENKNIARLCAQSRIGGANVTDAQSAAVVKAIADGNFFKVGGVLVGTHAFSATGNVLGVRFSGASLKTYDIDLAGFKKIEVAIGDVSSDIPTTLDSLNMGFFPVPPLNHKLPSTSFKVRGSELRVDVLTPLLHSEMTDPIYINRIKTAALPLRYLDYLIENPIQAAVIDGSGILINIPEPARYAFHKLIVSVERESSNIAKSNKDIFQAAQIFEVLLSDRPGDLLRAWDALKVRGKSFIKRAESGLLRLSKEYPDIFKEVKAMTSE